MKRGTTKTLRAVGILLVIFLLFCAFALLPQPVRATKTVTSTVTGLSDPYGVAVTPNGAYVYVTNDVSNTVFVISTGALTVSVSPSPSSSNTLIIIIGVVIAVVIIVALVFLMLQTRGLKTKKISPPPSQPPPQNSCSVSSVQKSMRHLRLFSLVA